jgi:small subunit ribosomal protein S17e
MGRIRNKRIRMIANKLLREFPDYFTTDFEENKKRIERVAIFRSKKLRNQVAGYIVHLLKKQAKLLGKGEK